MKRNSIVFLTAILLIAIIVVNVARNPTTTHAASPFPNNYSIGIYIQKSLPTLPSGYTTYGYEFFDATSTSSQQVGTCYALTSNVGEYTYSGLSTSSTWQKVAIDVMAGCSNNPSVRSGPIIAEYDFTAPTTCNDNACIFSIPIS